MKLVTLINTDITEFTVDVIVNSANKSLLGGGGLDYIIQKKAGIKMQNECRRIHDEIGGSLANGHAVVTTAGNLPSKFLIHTVGPRWLGGTKNETEELCKAYLNSLIKANEVQAKTVSFPSISTGVYRYPKQEAAEIAIGTVLSSLPSFEHIEHVYFVCHDQENFEIYKTILSSLDDPNIKINIS
ncbi:macro domain-containing protein [Acinetobacter sp. ANC 5378]|uniref:macro domain-containing protein n=1 Tax=Acinetobacter sp. ANC 5378 TaxID=2731249 RepID=UPI0014903DED|nr:macro domain-containing protein [Acinetobacter sp. ANC 5378]NNG82600.1 macro domain-containing protein [Acinetobacter sp. ANC 5378]